MPTIDYGVFVWPSSANASVGTNNAAIPTSSTLIGGSDGTTLRPIKTDATGIVQAAVTSSVLPTGAATSANQTSGSQKTQISDSSGDAVTIRQLNNQPVNGDYALETISVTHGLSTLGNQYIDVKVNSSTNAMMVDASSATVTVTGNVAATQSGTWGVGLNAGTNLVGKVGIDQTTPGTTNAVSLAQVGSTTVATGNGVAGTGVQRVTIASDNTAFSVNAAQSGTWGVGLNAGSNIVGNVGIDQTTPGTTNGVQVNAALPAGSNIIGKTGIDQTTPGTTNAVSLAQVGSTTVATGNGVSGTGVQRVTIASDNTAFSVNAAQSGTWGVGLNAGSNLVGKVGIDQTTPGTTNGVQVNAALPAGSNLIGKVGLDQTTPGTSNAISLAQVGSTTVATGNGVAGTGVQRVTIASDNTAFSVNAAQSGTWNIGNVTSITNAVTVSGTVAATQSGTWGVGLNAGSNIVGKFGIDQTTPGTTNGVQVNAALPAGSNIVGKFGIDQTTPGTTNGVQVNAALPAGSNIIGKTGIDQTTPGTTNAISLAQVGSTTVATGNGVSGTGVQRVTIASDNTAFTVNAAQSGTWTVQPGNTPNTTAWLTTQSGRTTANTSAFNDYTATSVTTSAYVQLVASTSNAVSEVEIFDSSGQGMILATGAAGSETDQIYIFPGGNGRVPLKIAASTRVAIKAKTATASSGYIMVNFYA